MSLEQSLEKEHYYIEEFERILGDSITDGDVDLSLPVTTLQDCRQSEKQIKLMKEELHVLKRQIQHELKKARKEADERIKKLRGYLKAAKFELSSGLHIPIISRAREKDALEEMCKEQEMIFKLHESKIDLIDDVLIKLDKASLQIDARIEELKPKKERDPIPEDVQVFVWNRDGGKCVKCGSTMNLEFDHIIPISKGGNNTARNLQILCEACNRKKGDSIGG